jgi:hypothetical protein
VSSGSGKFSTANPTGVTAPVTRIYGNLSNVTSGAPASAAAAQAYLSLFTSSSSSRKG